ncbi:MAG: sulfate adenylyltransferase [Proteobacteria bacterium]|nr:MAG: sulfate adenylyltransferase [Pseudomonadota bacterium]
MTVQGRVDLVPVHGGLAEPVDRVVPLSQRAKLLAEAAKLPSIAVTKADLSTVHRIADGTLSPLEGPMGRDAWHRVLDEGVVLCGGKRYAWGIPLALPVTDAEARALAAGGSAAMRAESGDVVAVLDEVELFEWDKPKYVRGVYLTERVDHPGGRMAMDDARTKLVGGRLRALPQEQRPEWTIFSPRLTRAFIRDKKWQRALAFQTRNPLHRAHEYALVAGVERLTREGFFTGVVLNPLVGELKGDDVPAATRMRCYRALHDGKLLGVGDKDESLWKSVGYDLTEVFEVLPLDIKMFYGGPKEAVMHAVYRQNHGFSHLVIGRKHADAPFADGSPIWGDFDAQQVFDSLPGELHLAPCKIGFAAFYESIGRVDLTDDHPNEKPFAISGTKVREQLQKGERPDPRIIRPEISEILIEAYRA